MKKSIKKITIITLVTVGSLILSNKTFAMERTNLPQSTLPLNIIQIPLDEDSDPTESIHTQNANPTESIQKQNAKPLFKTNKKSNRTKSDPMYNYIKLSLTKKRKNNDTILEDAQQLDQKTKKIICEADDIIKNQQKRIKHSIAINIKNQAQELQKVISNFKYRHRLNVINNNPTQTK